MCYKYGIVYVKEDFAGTRLKEKIERMDTKIWKSIHINEI